MAKRLLLLGTRVRELLEISRVMKETSNHAVAGRYRRDKKERQAKGLR
jgi:hypothetical protein